MGGRGGEPAQWRSELRRAIATLLALKLAALSLLWWAFFSPSHRTAVDAAAASQRLSLAPRPLQRPALPEPQQGVRSTGESE
jgi:hypothetical protein